MKALGKDIKEFWLRHWPAGMYVEEEDESLFNEDGDPVLDDTAKYELSRFGYLLAEDPASEGKEDTFAAHFSGWQKRRLVASIVITVPREKLAETVQLLATLGLRAATN